MTVSAYPLSWPTGFPRCKSREGGRFQTTLYKALDNVQSSLNLFARDSGKKIDGLIISSNVTLGANNPADPGVSVWFTWDGINVCIPVDRYTRVEANLQAIHHIVEARRTELRHGTLALVRATFTGFAALPPPKNTDPWWEVLRVPKDAQRADVDAAYRRLRSEHHPDKGGSSTEFQKIQIAYEQAMGG